MVAMLDGTQYVIIILSRTCQGYVSRPSNDNYIFICNVSSVTPGQARPDWGYFTERINIEKVEIVTQRLKLISEAGD